jgi:hypothetical protein
MASWASGARASKQVAEAGAAHLIRIFLAHLRLLSEQPWFENGAPGRLYGWRPGPLHRIPTVQEA